jgi:phosphoglycerate dehydrogenase-like enzyme
MTLIARTLAAARVARMPAVLLWVSERPERGALVVPEGVEVASIPGSPEGDRDLGRVEVLVPPYGSRRVLAALPSMSSLRLIQTLESGVDWLLPQVPPGVTVCNSRGAHDAAVAEWVLGVILAMQRHLPEHLRAQEQGLWREIVRDDEWQPPYAGDLEGATVLIVGHGSIGAAVERRLQPFGVETRRVARRRREGVEPVDSLPGLVGLADIVVLLVPLTEETERLFDAPMLAAMKPGALLVNAGRGRVVDQDALVDALYGGHLRAALDVTDPEPLPPGHRLWSAPSLLLTPHMAGDTPHRYRRSWQLVGEQVRRLLTDEALLNVVE